MVVILGVVYELEVASNDPPLDALYQLMVLPLAPKAALKPTVPVPHLEPFVVVGFEGIGLIIAEICKRAPSQPLLLL